MRQLAMFEGVKERILCSKCGSANTRWRRKVNNYLCLRCGQVFDAPGPAKERAK